MKIPIKVLIIAGLIIGLAVINTLPANPLCSEASASKLVKVAILDSGSNIAYREGISLIDGTVRDYNGHGTLMARIIKEVNPDAELYIVKVMGKNGLAVNEDAVILGLQWAISRDVDVINMSLRLKGSARLHQVIEKAYKSGIIIVAAAGNTTSRWSVSRGGLDTYDTADNTQYEVACPAKYKEVIAVGALDRYGRVYDGSIEGREVDVHCKGYKGREAGTSIASAYCAGLASKIISENPDCSTQEIKNIISQKTGKVN